jgi:hypothetical protein
VEREQSEQRVAIDEEIRSDTEGNAEDSHEVEELGPRRSSVKKGLKRKQYTPEQARNALRDIAGGMSTKKASKVWGVPRTTLIDLRHMRYSVESKPGPSTVLSEQEEQLLCEWMIELCRRGIPINKNCLLDTVLKILEEDGRNNPFQNNRPGDGWFNGFLKRHPEIAQRNAESINRSRGALTEECIRGWFRDAEKFFADKNMSYILRDPKRQYNGDETGFQLDPKSGRVMAPRGESVYTEAGGNKEQLSVLVTTRADGKVMTCAIVYPYKRAVPSAIVDNVPSRFCVAKSDSGWMTSDIFFEYFANVFLPELAAIRRIDKGLKDDDELVLTDEDWVVYWIDGYSSHLTLHTSQLCDRNKVVLYCFKAHSSHLCQSNDLGPFKPLKKEWRDAVQEWRKTNAFEILSRAEFAKILDKAIEKLNLAAVTAGYRAAGLFPFDANNVHYDRLTETRRRCYRNVGHEEPEQTVLNKSEAEVVLQSIENFLGPQIVTTYNTLCDVPCISDDQLPPINAYLLWRHFKVEASKSIGNLDQNCDMTTIETEEVQIEDIEGDGELHEFVLDLAGEEQAIQVLSGPSLSDDHTTSYGKYAI